MKRWLLLSAFLTVSAQAQTNCISNVTSVVITTNPPPPVITTNMVTTNVVYQCGPPPSTNGWAKAIGGAGIDVGYATATDAGGNVIVAGYFSGTADFGGGSRVSAGAQDIFVAKFDSAGTYLWSATFGGSGDDEALALAVDKVTGAVYVTGYFNGTATFGSQIFTSTYLKNLFAVKLNSAGAQQWAKQIGGTSSLGNSVGYSVAVDQSTGDVVLGGVVAGNVDFGAGVTYVSVDSAPFVARYTSSGAYVFAKSFYAGLVGNPGRVAVDSSGNVYLGIHSQQSVNFGNGALPHPVGTGNDIYLAKFSPQGTLAWSAAYTTADCQLFALAVDPSGNLAMAGRFIGRPWDLGGGILLNSTPTSAQQQSAFVARLSAVNGTVSSASSFTCTNIVGGTAISMANAVAFDGQGNYIVTGVFFGSGLAGSTRLTAPTLSDSEAFAIKYSSANAVVWAKQFGGTGSDQASSSATDGSANVVVAGSTFGGNFNGTMLPSHGSVDAFLLKLGP